MDMNDDMYQEDFDDENELLLGQDRNPYIYMGPEDGDQGDDMYGEEYQHQFDEDPFSNHQQYASDENPGFVDAHYIKTEQVLPNHHQKAAMAFDLFENPNFVEFIDPKKRLEFCPLARHVPAVRRNWRTGDGIEEDKIELYIPKCGITVDPEESMENYMLVRNKIFPKHGEIFVKPESPPYPTGRKQPWKLNQHYNIKQVKMSEALRKVSRPKPAITPEPRTTDLLKAMTPLPNMFFQRRLTVTAEQIGFNSDNAKCTICNFIFRQNTLLTTHMKKHHGSEVILKPSIGMLCPMPECETRCDSVSSTVKHMNLDHKIPDLPFERILFKDMEEFKKWKAELERLTMSRYSRTSGRNNMHSKSTYYQCQLSGSGYRARTTNQYQPELTRNRISKRLGRACTAFFHIRENEEDGSVLLRGCTMHCGHGKEVRLLPLTEEMRMEVAHLLISGMDENQIIEKMRAESDVNDRRFYLQVYEIRNIYNKIDKFKEDFKRKMENGEPLPDLVNVGRAATSHYPTMKAQLARGRYPVNYDPDAVQVDDPEFDDLVLQQDEEFGNQRVIQEDGEFHIPDHYVDYMDQEREYEVQEEEEDMQSAKNKPKDRRGVTSPIGRNTARKQSAKRRKIDQTTLEEDSDHLEDDFSVPSTSTAPPKLSKRENRN